MDNSRVVDDVIDNGPDGSIAAALPAITAGPVLRPDLYDQHDPALQYDPYPTYKRMREECPIGKSDMSGGFYYFTTFEDVDFAYHNPELFSSYPNMIPAPETGGSTGSPGALIPLEIDPPDHAQWRRIVDPLLAPKVVAGLESAIRADVVARIDQILERGSCEFIEDLAVPVPCRVFLEFMDMPVDMLDTLLDWKDRVNHAKGAEAGDLEGQMAVRMQAGFEVAVCYAELIQKRRAEPGDDFVSHVALKARKRDGEPPTDEELINLCFLFFMAGLDTVTSSLGNAFAYLAANPREQQTLVEQPQLIKPAIEEFLRYDSPIAPGRTITRAFDYKGVSFRPGDRVMLLHGAAGRDPAVFAEPETVRFDRSPNRHMAFGVGPHRCAGSHLGRLEMKVVLEEWHRRIPRYRLTPGRPLSQTTGFIRRVEALHLTVD